MISLNLSYFYGSAERSFHYVSFEEWYLRPRLVRFVSAKINTPHGTTKYLIDKKF